MNRDQIIAKWETLTPRERDAWVGKIVIGISPEFNVNLELQSWKTGPRSWSSSIPFYTSDIGAAWTVLDRYETYEISRSVEEVKVYVKHERESATAVRDNAPEAICLAAIIAKITAEDKA